MDGVRHIRDRFNVPVSDEISKNCRTSPSRKVLKSIPIARSTSETARLSAKPPAELHRKLELPSLQDFGALLEEQSKGSLPLSLSFVL